ncbi:MAG: hypothetical protein CVU61_14495 [Deltaproteobacteria bacterium HGW-Deltaproteobacteria-19]|jgi:replicative DNA helicase|nr:MAG: hypothetical protein CVU61_14495 [Deltaproteobacteria bacterium HGW-Deltaproteobacteria-19]
MTNVDYALRYLQKGFSTIPLWSPEMVRKNPPYGYHEALQKELEKNANEENPKPKEKVREMVLTRQCKKPCISGWTEYQKRLPTEEEVGTWFGQNPEPNIAIITGTVSNLVVFDLDSEDAVAYAEEEGGFPETVKVKTGKGYHVYMKHPGFPVKNSVNKDLAIDIRSDGGYVVAPPSIHGSGHQYWWEEGHSIWELDPAPCEPWMIQYLKDVNEQVGKKKAPKDGDNELNREIPDQDNKKPVKENSTGEFSRLLQEGCQEGERNHVTTSFIGHLFKTGMKPEEIWETVIIWNQTKVKPPLDLDELKRTFESVKSLEEKNSNAKKQAKVSIETFLDSSEKATAEYQKNYVRIPFAGDNLTLLESQMNGGFVGGRFYIFGGIPSSGKTVLLNNIADNICLAGQPVLFFSYDDGRSEIRYRTFSRFSKYPIDVFNTRQLKDLHGICENQSIQTIMSLKYVVQEMIPVEKWCDLIDQIVKKHGRGPVIIIDYLRKLRTEKGSGDERLRVDDIIGKLNQIAKNYNIPVIAISELARDSYKSGQRLSMASFKESGSIEYEASWLGILGAVEEDDGEYKLKENWDTIIEHDGNIDLIVFKAKRGTGSTGKVPLKVDKILMTVTNREDRNEKIPLQSSKKSRFE